jgi:hypothetical protein
MSYFKYLISSALLYVAFSTDYSYTGSFQTITAPSSSLFQHVMMDVVICGAAGGSSLGTGTGGSGICIQTPLTVEAGSLIYLYIGGLGTCGTGVVGGGTGLGGWNGGGNAGSTSGTGCGGGGASDIRIGGQSLANRVLIAGGGGGAGGACNSMTGGNAGLTTGGYGTNAVCPVNNYANTGGGQTMGGTCSLCASPIGSICYDMRGKIHSL